MEYTCAVCKQKLPGDMIIYKEHTDQHVLDLVKHDHPEWVEDDGMCQKCIDYYQAEINGSVFGDAPCAMRIRKAKGVLSPIVNLFKKDKK